MSLVAGSYEKFIWGFKLKTLKSQSETKTLTLTPLFSYPSHLSTIKSVAVSGPVAVSGGSDDSIKIYDLSTASEIGTLNNHSGSITSLSFFTPPSLSFPRNLFSASDDGTLCIYDADPFVHLKTVKVHKKGVNDLAVHPSGRLALTVGRDSCLAMVNLVRGRRSFSCKMWKEASIVKYDESGEKFFMVEDEKVSVHEAEDAKLILELDNRKRVLCATLGSLVGGDKRKVIRKFYVFQEVKFTLSQDEILLTGGEDRNITAWDTKSGKIAYCIKEAHSVRVKGLVVLSKSDIAASGDGFSHLVASASSDGVIRVWDIRMANQSEPNHLAEAKTKSRLTCLAGSSLRWVRILYGNHKLEKAVQMISRMWKWKKILDILGNAGLCLDFEVKRRPVVRGQCNQDWHSSQ
ncbi:WD40 repeat [Dillenia turbinata]|uniref:WD40 repeat n=1 Tax=Dillenia turbinata TaxID=194707 RepID=A0AAN8VLZ6_9MAGN